MILSGQFDSCRPCPRVVTDQEKTSSAFARARFFLWRPLRWLLAASAAATLVAQGVVCYAELMEITGTRPLDQPLLDIDETKLVAQLRAGEPSAFEQVVRAYGPRLLAITRRFLQHEQDAQDAVQDALLSAFKSLDQFKGTARLGTWLHRIAVNAALMRLRQRRRRNERPIDDLLPRFRDDGHVADTISQWAIADDSAIHDREIRELVRRGIDELPDTYRTVLLLRDIEGQSTEETAETLGISIGAVKTRLHRARQALRSQLDQHLQEERS